MAVTYLFVLSTSTLERVCQSIFKIHVARAKFCIVRVPVFESSVGSNANGCV